MQAHKKIIYKITKHIGETGGNKTIYIPTQIAKHLQLQKGTPITISLENGKHGKYIAIWKNKQQKQK